MDNDLKVLMFFAVGIFLIKLYVFRQLKHDEKIIALMQKGEGPNHYITFWGRSITNTYYLARIIKERFNSQGVIRK